MARDLQHKWTQALVAKVMKPRMLKVTEENLKALSHQLQSQLRISLQDLIEIHPSYGPTTDYGQHSPLAIGPRERGCSLQSPCYYFIKFPKPTTYDFVGGNEGAAARVLSDLNKSVGRILGMKN